MRTLVSIDFETREFCRSEGPFPRPVCLSVASPGQETLLLGHDDARRFLQALLLRDPNDYLLIGHKLCGFDLPVAALHWPELQPRIWAWLRAGAISDTYYRERLLNLRRHGRLENVKLPDGSTEEIGYGLADLQKQYQGIDRSKDKEEDSWRTRYRLLENIPVGDWPADAIKYAVDDADGALAVWEAQQQQELANFANEPLICVMGYSLSLTTATPMHVDMEKKYAVALEIFNDLTPEIMEPLYNAGIYSRPELPRPFKRGGIDKQTQLPKMVEGQHATLKRAVLAERVKQAYERLGEIAPMTPKGGISTNGDAIAPILGIDAVIDTYEHVNYHKKLIDTELPRLGDGTYPVYFSFDLPKETGRTSSSAGWSSTEKHPEGRIWSANGQNIDPRVRPVFYAPSGWLILSVDFSSLELCSLAWRLSSLGLQSRLLDILQRGWDAHGYLGAQIMVNYEPWFRSLLESEGVSALDFDAVFLRFQDMRKNGTPEQRERCEHFRKLAKPTGLGFPGGLGIKRFVAYAKSQYGVDISEEEARRLKEIWFTIFPEMRAYFRHVEQRMRDPRFVDAYTYTSPLGMVRSNASYTATCNGNALQTPAAEGALLAFSLVVEAMWNPEAGDATLYGCRPVDFLHDEGLFFVPDDGHAWARAERVQRLFETGMSHILQGVPIRTEATLMRRWYKQAKPTYDDRGRLIPWDNKEGAA